MALLGEGWNSRFDFTLPLDDPSLVLLYYDGATYQPWTPTENWQRLNTTLDPFSL